MNRQQVRCSIICFEHKWVLVEAAKAQLNGEGDVAMRKFKEAIKLAAERGYMQDEAIARELKGNIVSETSHVHLSEQEIDFQFLLLSCFYTFDFKENVILKERSS